MSSTGEPQNRSIFIMEAKFVARGRAFGAQYNLTRKTFIVNRQTGTAKPLLALADEQGSRSFMAKDDNQFTDLSMLPRALGLSDAEETGERRELLLARVGGRLFGLFADEAASVSKWRQPTPLPRAPLAVLGVASVSGRMLTVIDPLLLLGDRRAEDAPPQFLVALRSDEQLALAVDRAERIIEISTDEIEMDHHHQAQLASGLVRFDGTQIPVLNVAGIFAIAMNATPSTGIKD